MIPRTMKDDPFIYREKVVTAPVGFSIMNTKTSGDSKKVVITFYRSKKKGSRKK